MGDMRSIVYQTVKQEKETHRMTFSNVVLLAMHAIERYSHEVKKLDGRDKLQSVEVVIPTVLEEAVRQEWIDEHKAARLQKKLTDAVDIVQDMVEAFVSIAHHPDFIQFVETVQQKCCVPRKSSAQ